MVQKMTELAMAKARILYHLGRLQEALDVAEWGLMTSLTAPSPEYLKFHDDLVRELAGLQTGHGK